MTTKFQSAEYKMSKEVREEKARVLQSLRNEIEVLQKNGRELPHDLKARYVRTIELECIFKT